MLPCILVNKDFHKCTLLHVFHAYNLLNLMFAVSERRFMQLQVECMQKFFFSVIFAV